MPLSEEAERIIGFIDRVEEKSSTQIAEWALGTALFNTDFPNKWDMNVLRIERDVPTWTAERVAAEAERLQSHLSHRKVVTDGRTGARLAQGFRRLGWNATRLVWMTMQAAPPEIEDIEVREISFEEALEPWVKVDTEERQMSREESEMVWRSVRDVLAPITGARLVGGFAEGALAGWCEYHHGEGVGQIENVSTTRRAQGRGVARSVIARALKLSAADGNDLHFLVADDDDWPKELYARLGFAPVAYTYDFLRKPRGR